MVLKLCEVGVWWTASTTSPALPQVGALYGEVHKFTEHQATQLSYGLVGHR